MEGLDERIGVVLGTKAASPVEFFVAVDRNAILQLDDAVYVRSKLPDGNNLYFYGIVSQVEKAYDGLTFDSDMYYLEHIPVETKYIAKVRTTTIEPEKWIPPTPGDPVYIAKGEKFEKAIGAEKMERKIFAGFSLTGNEKIYIDLDFIDGTKGAHVNISGVSGVATKTTYGVFLIQQIMSQYWQMRDEHYAVVVFNVKGEDLLFLDKANKRVSEETLNIWESILPGVKENHSRGKGLIYSDPKICVPPTADLKPNTSQRALEETFIFGINIYEFAKYGILRFIVSESDSDQIKDLAEELAGILYKLADKTKKDEGKNKKEEEINYISIVRGNEKKKIERLKSENEDYTLEKFIEEILDGEFKTGDNQINQLVVTNKIIKESAPGTKKAFLRRFRSAMRELNHIVRTEFTKSTSSLKSITFNDIANIKKGEVMVVDIGKMSDEAQRIIVGSLLSRIFEIHAEGGVKRKLLIMLDELSKYAPREGSSPIKSVLEDIAERGRSLGIILIGAEQSAKTVSRKIILNSSVKVVGRMSPEELESSEYGFLSNEMKLRLLSAQPGKLIIYQPGVFTPLPITFPYPFWATRKDEVLIPQGANGGKRSLSEIDENLIAEGTI